MPIRLFGSAEHEREGRDVVPADRNLVREDRGFLSPEREYVVVAPVLRFGLVAVIHAVFTLNLIPQRVERFEWHSRPLRLICGFTRVTRN